MANQYLLLKDVEKLGLSGEIVKSVKPGYARNFLLPRGLAIVADKNTIRLQQKLQEERAQKRLIDKEESEKIAARINEQTIEKIVKVDHEGHMYGSVNVNDIVNLLSDNLQVEVEKKSIQLKHPIKSTGQHSIEVKLKEGVTAEFTLAVIAEEADKV